MVIYVSKCREYHQHQCQHILRIHITYPPSIISEGNHQTILLLLYSIIHIYFSIKKIQTQRRMTAHTLIRIHTRVSLTYPFLYSDGVIPHIPLNTVLK